MTKIDDDNDTKIKKKKLKLSFFPIYLLFYKKIDFKKRKKNRNSRIARVSFWTPKSANFWQKAQAFIVNFFIAFLYLSGWV